MKCHQCKKGIPKGTPKICPEHDEKLVFCDVGCLAVYKMCRRLEVSEEIGELGYR